MENNHTTLSEELQALLDMDSQKRREKLADAYVMPKTDLARLLLEAVEILGIYLGPDAEKRTIHLPCTEGDTVYKVCRGACDTVQYIQHEGHTFSRTIPDLFVTKAAFRKGMWPDLGKTIFLSQEEAKQKIKEMQD